MFLGCDTIQFGRYVLKVSERLPHFPFPIPLEERSIKFLRSTGKVSLSVNKRKPHRHRSDILGSHVQCATKLNSYSVFNFGMDFDIIYFRRVSEAVQFLGLRVRIPPWAWRSVSCECCMLLGRDLYEGLITRQEECDVCECDREPSTMRPSWPTRSSCAIKNILKYFPEIC